MASAGPNNPGTAAIGDEGLNDWVNPTNALTSNDQHAHSMFGAGNSYSEYLKLTNYGFESVIPTGSIINGIVVSIERRADLSTTLRYVKDYEVKLIKADGTLGNTNKADTVTKWPTTEGAVSYGTGTTDLWGEIWTSADINDVDFGVALKVLGHSDEYAGWAEVDVITVTVYYTEVSGPANLKTVNGLAKASVKVRNGLAIGSIKTWDGLA